MPAASSAAAAPTGSEERPAFVLHEHHKPRHHYDLRLEEGGVLRSWAVPRGMPAAPGENRLAVAVPDHALEHQYYTDADKAIADQGWWEEHDRNDKRIVFTLHGEQGARRYALIHTSKDWLLHLTKSSPSHSVLLLLQSPATAVPVLLDSHLVLGHPECA